MGIDQPDRKRYEAVNSVHVVMQTCENVECQYLAAVDMKCCSICVLRLQQARAAVMLLEAKPIVGSRLVADAGEAHTSSLPVNSA